jgi:hypothetical protein
MSTALRVAISGLLLVRSSLVAQVTEAALKSSYRVTEDGAFIVGAGAELKAVFDSSGEACTLTLHGPVSENRVFHIFDVLVPVKTRGVKKQDMIECVGVCQRILVYKNVALTIGAVGKQTSEPAAVITFSRPACKAAVAEASKAVLKIKRNDESAAASK